MSWIDYNKLILVLVSLFTGFITTKAQNSLSYSSSKLTQIKNLKAKVEANPNNIKAHQAFVNAFSNNKLDDSILNEQYKTWLIRFPKIYAVPFAIGEEYVNRENPMATSFLLRASTLKPKEASVWYLLAKDAAYKNNLIFQREYLKKAIQCSTNSPDYAFYYADSYKNTDPLRYDSLSLDVARRFPDSEMGARALFWLANNTNNPSEQVAYYKQLFNRKSNQYSDWYLSGMIEYFDLLLKTKPEQAFDLGLTMILNGKRNLNLFKDRIKVADAFLRARKFLIESQPSEALAILEKVNIGTIESGNKINVEEDLAIFKAEAADAAKLPIIAYDSLIVLYAKLPTERLYNVLLKYGEKLCIDSNNVVKSIWKIRDSLAIKATNFSLEKYKSSGKASLSDYQGKVILLTYWFPACGPCLAEFPHFESVIKKFDGTKVAYLGLNLQPIQDKFVLPFLIETGYSFTPLHDDWKRDKGNLAAFGAPTNYLIDQKGRIIFSGFSIDKENEKTLELMIKETLAAKDY